MGFISRGFHGRRHAIEAPPGRVPPGQHLVGDFPVLSAGPTPHIRQETWDFALAGAVTQSKRWTWTQFLALPQETVTVDIHCVTSWSKLDTHWQGVSLDTLLAQVAYDVPYLTAFCDGGYTTNLPIADLTNGKAWIVHTYEGAPLAPEHGGTGSPARAAPLLLEKRQVGARPAPDE